MTPTTPKRRQLEVCVDSAAGLLAAVEAGADRIELCAALALSGLTPTPGLMKLAAALPTPSYAMIRAHSGEFRYGSHDLDVMRGDIDAARAAGLPGVVVGANRASGELDEAALAILVAHAAGLGLTLHRAFDLVPDMDHGLEVAIGLGFERILTSGGAPSALQGADRLADLVVRARGRISIMAGGGVTPANVAELVARTGVLEVHGSFSARLYAPAGLMAPGARTVELGFVRPDLKDTEAAAVAEALAVLRGLVAG